MFAMVVGVYFLLFSLIFIGALTNVALALPFNLGTAVVDACYCGLAAIFVFKGGWHNIDAIKRLKLPIAIFLIYALWCAIVSLTGTNGLYERVMGFRNNVIYPGIWLIIALSEITFPIRKIIDFIWFAGIFVCAYAIEQAIFFIDMPNPMLWLHDNPEIFEFHNLEQTIFRVNGLVGNPLVFAGFSSFVLIAGWVRLAWDKRWWNKLLLVLPPVAMYLSYTRSALVALPVALGLAWLVFTPMPHWRRVLVLVCGVMALVFLIFGGRFGPACVRNQFIFQRMAGTESTTRASNETRWVMMMGGWNAIKQHPWCGIGNGSQGYSVKIHTDEHAYGGDGSFFALLLETGAVGFTLAMLFLFICAIRVVKYFRVSSRGTPEYALGCLLITGGFFFALMSLLNSSFTCRTNLCLYFLLLGLAFEESNPAMGAVKYLPPVGLSDKLCSILDVMRLPKVVIQNSNLLWQMTRRGVEQRYRGSTLGLVWSFVQPLMMLCVYTFVFSIVFQAKWGVGTDGGKGSFAVIMFCGMAMYNLFSEAITLSCGCITGQPNLVKKVIFPLEILPLSQVLTTFILGMAWIVLLFLGSYFILHFIGWTMLLLPIILLPLFVFTLGVSYFVASFSVYVRDTQYVIGVILQILFFATPIFYPVSAVPKELQWVLTWNPLSVFIEQARNVFLYGKLPDWAFLGCATLVALVVMQLGYFFFIRTKRGFADVL